MTAFNNSTNNAALKITTGIVLPNNLGSYSSSLTLAGSADQVKCFPIFFEYEIIVAKLAAYITTNFAGSSFGVGIYNSDGTTLLVDSGVLSSASGGLKTVTLGAPVTLSPGTYILAATCTSTTPTARSLTLSNYHNFLNAFTTRCGTAANASSGGQLPATTGVITSASINMPLVYISAV